MSRWFSAAAVVTLLGLAACGGGSAGELLETAQLEEVQHNVPHARALYAEIVRRYPDSPAAATARQRLGILEQTP